MTMKGSGIIVSANPEGKHLEGYISGALKPGVAMQLKASTDPVNNRFTWEVYNPTGGDGTRKLVAVLLPDALQGKTYDDAYVTGTRCFLYVPKAGEEINMRKADITGTGSPDEDLNIGEDLMLIAGTGKVAPEPQTGVGATVPAYPFTALEALVDQAAEALVHCLFNGH